MIRNFPVFQQQVSALQNKTLSEAALQELLKTVYDARLSNVHNVEYIDYKLPRIRRLADTGDDAYSVFNRVQEVLMRGGIKYTYQQAVKDTNGNVLSMRRVNTSTRGIASVTQQVKLNQLVYDKTLELAA